MLKGLFVRRVVQVMGFCLSVCGVALFDLQFAQAQNNIIDNLIDAEPAKLYLIATGIICLILVRRIKA